MEEFIQIILVSGKSAVNLTLYVLLPVMVVMMAFMRLLEAKGVLLTISRIFSPILKVFGIHGLGAFAMIQMIFVGFAAPIATLSIMEGKSYSRRELSAVLAMILCMSQANAVYPLLTIGLDFYFILFTSLVGGAIAACLTYYLFARNLNEKKCFNNEETIVVKKQSSLKHLVEGGQEGMKIVISSIPLLMLALFVVNLLGAWGIIGIVETGLTPLTDLIAIPSISVLPFITKYLAGGTAMMGVTVELINEAKMSALDLNRIAGWMTNPLDLVGLGLYASAGPKTASVIKIALPGAVCGLIVRGLLHFLYY